MKNLRHYMSLPYTLILRKDEDGDFVARVEELSGCAAHGKTETEALRNLEEAKELWVSDCLETGSPVPEPAVEEVLPSGKWVQRVPRSLHKQLVLTAKQEGVSLNQLVTSVLSEAVGRRQAGDRRQKPVRAGDCSLTG
jgi:antitoxin HicB